MFGYADSDFVIAPVKIPTHWPRVWALDIDGNKASCLWGAWERDGDVLYIYAECVIGRSELALVADAIRKRGLWIPGLFDHLARKRSKPEGMRITDALLELKLDIFTVQADAEAAVAEVTRRLTTKRIKVFDICSEWLAQYRAYRRNKDGDLLEESDGLMRAMDLLAMAGTQIAQIDGAVEAEAKAEWAEETRSNVTGY